MSRHSAVGVVPLVMYGLASRRINMLGADDSIVIGRLPFALLPVHLAGGRRSF
jgi:hypothetical protein